ncbi:MAG: response regulator transcription factor [Patescibacteria group bacterium]|jgi:DNA-binding response OmpR family regulator
MRILIVEDEHKIAQALKKGLEQETFSVDLAYTGTEGYDMASTEEYDVIVLDVMLPKMNGFEICKKLREDENHTPIMMLTARSELDDKLAGLNTGADDYLTKPFAFEELLARLRALMRRPKKALETTLRCGDLSLNTQTFLVSRQEKEISLSKTEYALLEYLMRNLGKTLSKEQIIAHVWDYDSDILPNTVERYMGYLRTKLEEPFKKAPKLIHTIRGFGYILKCKKE